MGGREYSGSSCETLLSSGIIGTYAYGTLNILVSVKSEKRPIEKHTSMGSKHLKEKQGGRGEG